MFTLSETHGLLVPLSAIQDNVTLSGETQSKADRFTAIGVIAGVEYKALQPSVTGALSSLDRGGMLGLAEQLDAANNLGCPL